MNLEKIEARQVIRFLVVGCCNTLSSYLIYALSLYLGANFVWANFFAVVFGICISFTTQKKFVFESRRRGSLVRYILFWLVIWGANVFVIWALMQIVSNSYIAGALALVPITILSFFIQKFWVF